MSKRGVGKYVLIYDTGDLVFTNLTEAKEFAERLLKKGRGVDRIQTLETHWSGTKPKIIVDYYLRQKRTIL